MALQDTLDQLRGLEIGDLDVNNIGGWPAPLKAIILVLLVRRGRRLRATSSI